MMDSEKNTPGPTSFAPEIIALRFCKLVVELGNSEIFLWAFSTITIDASTIAPIAMAIPLNDIMLTVIP